MDTARDTARLRLKALCFIALAFALTGFIDWDPLRAIGGMMWAPGIAALVVQLGFERRLSGLGWRLPNWRWWLAALAFPGAYVALAYALAWSLGLADLRPDAEAWLREVLEVHIGLPVLPGWALVPAFASLVLSLGMAMSLVSSLGEEIGWRGLLFPTLDRVMGFRNAALASGAVWAVWHWHGILWNGYNAGADPLYSLAMFTAMIVAMSWGMAWLTKRSASLWPAVVVHAGHNVFIQGAFEPLTVRPDAGQWVTGEWGWAIPLMVVVVMAATFAWRRRGAAVR